MTPDPPMIVRPAEIDGHMRACMLALMGTCYEAVRREDFERDLDEKDLVIVTSAAGDMTGFTTLAVGRTKLGGRFVRHIFSGDTVVRPDLWGRGHLLRCWFHLAGRLKAHDVDDPLYWLLIVKGHRTFRILSSFFHEYVPCPGGPADIRLLDVRDALAAERFNGFYDRRSGLIDFQSSRGHLLPHLQDAQRLASFHPAVRRFLELNPGHHRGVELACLAELREDNLKSYAAGAFAKGMTSSIPAQTAGSAVQGP